LVVGFVFLWHGVPKALDPQLAMDKFVGFGLPGIRHRPSSRRLLGRPRA
jgi:hypothetical protein